VNVIIALRVGNLFLEAHNVAEPVKRK